MATSTTTLNGVAEATREATEAFNETTKIATQTARQSADAARASVDVARSFYEETSELTGDFVGAWAAAGETLLKTVFETQNTALEAGLKVFDATAQANRRALTQFVELTAQGQKSLLAGFQKGVTAVERLSFEAARSVNPKA